MYAIAENIEITTWCLPYENVIHVEKELHNTSTTSFLVEILKLNFTDSNTPQKNFKNQETNQEHFISTQNEVDTIVLPFYFNINKEKIYSIYNEIKSKYDDNFIQIENKINQLVDCLAELNFEDIYLEITKKGLIKFSILMDENKILIISKSISEDANNILYSYFINNQMIATNVCEIAPFVKKFKEFMSLSYS